MERSAEVRSRLLQPELDHFIIVVKKTWLEEIRWQMDDGNCWATDWEDWFDKAAVVAGKCLETVMVWEGGGGGEEGDSQRNRLWKGGGWCLDPWSANGREHECDLETWEVAMCVVTVIDTTRGLGQVPHLDLGSPELLEDVEV